MVAPVMFGNPDTFGSVGVVTGLPDPDTAATVIVDVCPVSGDPDLVVVGGPMALVTGTAPVPAMLSAPGSPVLHRMSVGNIHRGMMVVTVVLNNGSGDHADDKATKSGQCLVISMGGRCVQPHKEGCGQ